MSGRPSEPPRPPALADLVERIRRFLSPDRPALLPIPVRDERRRPNAADRRSR